MLLLCILAAPSLAQTTNPATTQPVSQPATRAAATEPAKPIIGQALAIGPFGRAGGGGGRGPFVVDPIEASIVAGEWRAPRSDDAVVGADGKAHRWHPIQPKENVWNDESLQGGWAYVPVDSPDERIVILAASSHAMVYVNGEPRAGDPYEWGFVHVPVLLRAGRNDLLFACTRGRLRVELTPPRGSLSIDTADLTLPDFIKGQSDSQPFGAVVINATTQPVRRVGWRGNRPGGPAQCIGPLAVRKLQLPLTYDGAKTAKVECPITVEDSNRPEMNDTVTISFDCVDPGQNYRRTFVSAIDDSVQYYSIVPAQPPPSKEGPKPALVISLHGAAVQATSQAGAYESKRWAYIVCPTNRRPYGFDWEDWGRIDALEVLERAQALLGTDRSRTYLTGHSMGGHGTWQVGAHYPDRFAALGPSAGWLSFDTYGLRRPRQNLTGPSTAPSTGAATTRPAMIDLFRRANADSDTVALFPNLQGNGIYILHGVDDDNVPISESRTAARILGQLGHRDWIFFEQPHAGHWWDNNKDEPGADCVDWPAMFDLFAHHAIPSDQAVREVSFRTMNPAVSSRCHWLTIDAQVRPMLLSSASVRCDPGSLKFTGTTENVARLRLDLRHLAGAGKLTVELDGSTPGAIELPEHPSELWLSHLGDEWKVSPPPTPLFKNAARGGPFKMGLNNHMASVYGTAGSAAENAALYAKARYDAELWWVRGNGSVDVIADSEFDPVRDPDRNVILYGNADTNRLWTTLVGDAPILTTRTGITVGGHEFVGDELACLFVRPRKGSDTALVGVVAGTGLTGIRLTNRIGYLMSGVGLPDWCVIGPEVLKQGIRGARAAGYFANDWTISPTDTIWADRESSASPATEP
jgi:pimeloyl-ACP methyl ester carboxylesterase